MSTSGEPSKELEPTDFEREFELVPLGSDLEARLARAERLLSTYLKDALASESEHATLTEYRPIEAVVDEFRDPEEVRSRDEWRIKNPDMNQD
jgi:hypothetical protein